jgi:hypothetical protein
VAIRDVRQGDANRVGGQQTLDLLQLVKDANGKIGAALHHAPFVACQPAIA